MRRLTYENSRGEGIVFYLSPLVISSLTGIGEVEAELQGQRSPYQDGDAYIDAILQPRFINLEGTITKTNLSDIKIYRKHILRVCNPKLGLGKITLELDGDKKEIYGALDGVPVFPERGQQPWQHFMITWKCPNPYWLDETDNKSSLLAYRNGLRYPFSFPKSYGIEGQSIVVVNEGDVNTPIEVEFFGPSLNPTLVNETTGEFIKVYRQLRSGEKLTVNTDFNKKRVEIMKAGGVIQNAYGYVDWFESSFLKLIPGNNVLKYTADSGTEDAVVNVTYRNRYVGI